MHFSKCPARLTSKIVTSSITTDSVFETPQASHSLLSCASGFKRHRRKTKQRNAHNTDRTKTEKQRCLIFSFSPFFDSAPKCIGLEIQTKYQPSTGPERAKQDGAGPHLDRGTSETPTTVSCELEYRLGCL